MKRLFDIIVSGLGITLLSPLLLVVLMLVWLQDKRSPFYRGKRVGMNGKLFQMLKIRSMVVGAASTGVESTSATDSRITPIGHFVRKWKIDELGQLWNVLRGDMSLVGPRPNTENGVAAYSDREMQLLNVRPGITDFASIVFSDEGEILRDAVDPDAEYNRLIRPWKSELGLIYVSNSNVSLDVRLIFLTVIGIANKKVSLKKSGAILRQFEASEQLLDVVKRNRSLGEFASTL